VVSIPILMNTPNGMYNSIWGEFSVCFTHTAIPPPVHEVWALYRC
jgi:hypothetical protein